MLRKEYVLKDYVLLLNLDKIKNKNTYQFSSMANYGYRYLVFSYHGDFVTAGKGVNYRSYVYKRNILLRLIILFLFFIKYRKMIHHVELYSGMGSFIVFEYFIARFFFVPVCAVERGSPMRDLEQYAWLGRMARKYVYRHAQKVWVRELWMKSKLRGIRGDSGFFLCNSVKVPERSNHDPAKDIDFIWCNSLIKWRNVRWYIDVLNNEMFSKTNNLLLGVIETENVEVNAEQQYVFKYKPNNLSILAFQPPDDFFLRSKFFVLPADIVFLNFALLEAMSYGVVPIISAVEGAELIVDHGVNGYIAEHNEASLKRVMKEAGRLPDHEYKAMSIKAREKVVFDYSLDVWSRNLNELYKDMAAYK